MGVLGKRGFALECSEAQVCREAGGRVSTNVRDLDIPGPHAAMDGRRLEVISDGLPLFDGAQVALDTTIVSPLYRDGLEEARWRKERTYLELNGAGGRTSAAEVGGRWSDETAQFSEPLPSTAPREVQLSCVSG